MNQNSIDELNRRREEHRQGFFTWELQKHKLLDYAWQLYVADGDITYEEAMEEAYGYISAYYRDVINYKTKIYF